MKRMRWSMTKNWLAEMDKKDIMEKNWKTKKW